MSLHQKLAKVQNELKAPKGQYNKFGGYNYRSAEDILQAVKPLLVSENLLMTITDELKLIGDRYYIEATVTVTDAETGDTHKVNAYAREAENKKGMDSSQITGAASSYARKYALNGMFAIDDTKDSDYTNKHDKDNSSNKNNKNKYKNNNSSNNKSSKVTCDHKGCNEKLSEKVINYCKSQSDKFDNKLLCFEHQKEVGSKK